MTRQSVGKLTNQQEVEEVYLATSKQLRPNRNGNLYLQVQLADRTGNITGMMWNANESTYRSFKDGDFLRISGTAQLYQGAMQMIVNHLENVTDQAAQLDPADFWPVTPLEIDRLVQRVGQLLRAMENPHLRALAECFLIDEAFMAKMSRAPAAVKNHHAYLGGLLEHVVNMMEVVDRIADRYPALDGDLLMVGVFLHDVGKIDELSYGGSLAYTDEGQLLGHLVQAIKILDDKIQETERLSGEPFPRELTLRLKHMIVSHHGQLDHGSPKVPMTLEAVALHYLDNLDAKLNLFERQMREDPNVDSPWTTYDHGLGRKLFKGYDYDPEENRPAEAPAALK
jgi:3'-5' exoribonuclease